jgi:hypothetical protein
MQANQTNGGVMLAIGHTPAEHAADAAKAQAAQKAAQAPAETQQVAVQ